MPKLVYAHAGVAGRIVNRAGKSAQGILDLRLAAVGVEAVRGAVSTCIDAGGDTASCII